MRYTTTLDQKVLVRAQLETRFADLTLAANTTLHNAAADFEKLAIEYRHLAFPPVIDLMAMADPIVTSAALYGASQWRAVTNTILKHTSSTNNAPNYAGGNYPVVELAGAIGIVGANMNVACLTACCLGYSTDNAATWIPLDGTAGTKSTERTFGDTCGTIRSPFATPTHPHYITGAAGYSPINFAVDRMVELVATFGGDEASFGNPASITHYCIMVGKNGQDLRSTPLCAGFGWLTLTARENAA